LNRDFEKDKSRKPNLADLRESGSIEQDADLVGLLYRADPDDPTKRRESDDDALSQDTVLINLLVAKQRNGPTGDVHLVFQRSLTRFESVAKVSDEDVPG
jgi:replicative DNA helicase